MPGGSDQPGPDKRLPVVKAGTACREGSSCRRVSEVPGSQLRCEHLGSCRSLACKGRSSVSRRVFEGKEPPNQAGVLSEGFLGSASAQEGKPQLLVPEEPVGNEHF